MGTRTPLGLYCARASWHLMGYSARERRTEPRPHVEDEQRGWGSIALFHLCGRGRRPGALATKACGVRGARCGDRRESRAIPARGSAAAQPMRARPRPPSWRGCARSTRHHSRFDENIDRRFLETILIGRMTVQPRRPVSQMGEAAYTRMLREAGSAAHTTPPALWAFAHEQFDATVRKLRGPRASDRSHQDLAPDRGAMRSRARPP